MAGHQSCRATHYGRLAAILLMGLFGITLLVPQLSERLTRRIVAWHWALGYRKGPTAPGKRQHLALLWSSAPPRECYGPPVPVRFWGC